MRAAASIILASLALGAVADDASLAAGKAVYMQTCVACHGANGKGAIPGIVDFTSKSGALRKSDDELKASVINGFQRPGAALAMPPMGGNPALNESDVQAVVEFVRAEFGRR